MEITDQIIIEKVPSGDPRAVSRLISLIENGSERGLRLLDTIVKNNSRECHIVGVTGPPGAGKSTLVDQLAMEAHREGKKVAILAVDPTSPFSGGAVLGDRIRMNRTAEMPDIFVRSMATRGALGGLARTTVEAVHVLRTAGFDLVFIETVGVGQIEVDISRAADTCVVVLVPGMGDAVQIMKAGILEIADLFVVNKSDREGAGLVERDLLTLLSLQDFAPEMWKPPVKQAIATEGKGSSEIVSEIQKHWKWLKETPQGIERRRRNMQGMLLRILGERISDIMETEGKAEVDRIVSECLANQLGITQALNRLGDVVVNLFAAKK